MSYKLDKTMDKLDKSIREVRKIIDEQEETTWIAYVTDGKFYVIKSKKEKKP